MSYRDFNVKSSFPGIKKIEFIISKFGSSTLFELIELERPKWDLKKIIMGEFQFLQYVHSKIGLLLQFLELARSYRWMWAVMSVGLWSFFFEISTFWCTSFSKFTLYFFRVVDMLIQKNQNATLFFWILEVKTFFPNDTSVQLAAAGEIWSRSNLITC